MFKALVGWASGGFLLAFGLELLGCKLWLQVITIYSDTPVHVA